MGPDREADDDATLTLGSSSAIFACGAARLGLSITFAGVVGDDLLGRFCREQLAARGVEPAGVIVDPAQRTGMTIILQRPDDRAMLTFPGAIAALTPDRVAQQLLDSARHIHVGSYYLQTALQAGLSDLFRAARRRGATTSLDTNWDPTARWAGLEALLAQTDLFLPNETEACAITGRAAWPEALAQLAARVSTVVIKRGAWGAVAARGDEYAEVAAPRVAVMDAVGAGDSFDAGFVYGALQGWPLPQTLRLAVACGALSTRAAGGTTAQAALHEALGLMERL